MKVQDLYEAVGEIGDDLIARADKEYTAQDGPGQEDTAAEPVKRSGRPKTQIHPEQQEQPDHSTRQEEAAPGRPEDRPEEEQAAEQGAKRIHFRKFRKYYGIIGVAAALVLVFAGGRALSGRKGSMQDMSTAEVKSEAAAAEASAEEVYMEEKAEAYEAAEAPTAEEGADEIITGSLMNGSDAQVLAETDFPYAEPSYLKQEAAALDAAQISEYPAAAEETAAETETAETPAEEAAAEETSAEEASAEEDGKNGETTAEDEEKETAAAGEDSADAAAGADSGASGTEKEDTASESSESTADGGADSSSSATAGKDAAETAGEGSADAAGTSETESSAGTTDAQAQADASSVTPLDAGVAGFQLATLRTYLTADETDNHIFSPVSAYLALTDLAEVSGGGTKNEILALLGTSGTARLRASCASLLAENYVNTESEKSIFANGLFLPDKTIAGSELLTLLASNYYTSTYAGEMGSEEYNAVYRDFVAEVTQNALGKDVDALTLPSEENSFALVSAVDYSAAFTAAFKKNATYTGRFRTPSGYENVTMMENTLATRYYTGSNFGAVKLPLSDGRYLWIFLPDNTADPSDILMANEWSDMLTGKAEDASEWADVEIQLPSFDVTEEVALARGLTQLGVNSIFNAANSDLTPLFGITDDYAAEASQILRVSVDENGVSTKAFTSDDPDAAESGGNWVSFKCTRPFLFVISDARGCAAVGGVIRDPR